jgi:hypothetical protein
MPLNEDDLSVIVAFGGQVGIMWGNQNDGTMYFARHVDGTPDNQWTLEIAYQRAEGADDHINLKADSSGRVYAAVKTSLNGPNDPLIHLVVRSTNGSWTSHVFGTVSNNHTRPVVVIDESAGIVHMFASSPCCSGGKIYHKQAPISNIVFPAGLGNVVLASSLNTTINNVASTKQTVSSATGLLIIAGDDTTRRYLHNFLPLGAVSTQSEAVLLGSTVSQQGRSPEPLAGWWWVLPAIVLAWAATRRPGARYGAGMVAPRATSVSEAERVVQPGGAAAPGD